MAADLRNRFVKQPKYSSGKIWRYMDFAKFVDLLTSRTLFFCRSDLLGDPFEGTWSEATVKKFPRAKPSNRSLMDMRPRTTLWQLLDAQPEIRQRTYISCWHLSEHESAAMWKLYALSNQAIAVQSSYENLAQALPSQCVMGSVQYIDYANEFIPVGHHITPFFRKRKSFEHEREVRVVFQKEELDGEKGVHFEINIDLLIEAVFIAPTAPRWYKDTVSKFIECVSIIKPVVSSILDSDPPY